MICVPWPEWSMARAVLICLTIMHSLLWHQAHASLDSPLLMLVVEMLGLLSRCEADLMPPIGGGAAKPLEVTSS